MRRSQISFFLTLAATAIFLLGLVGGWLLASWARQSAPNSVARMLTFGILVALLIALFWLWRFIDLYFIRIKSFVDEAQLILQSNPNRRLTPTGPPDIRALMALLNQYADRFQCLVSEREAEVQQARADLEEERNLLATLIADLKNGVVVCNPDGQILLYNIHARHLLSSPHTQSDTSISDPSAGAGGYVGLGRSIFGLLDRHTLTFTLNQLQKLSTPAATIETDQSVSRFITTATNGTPLRAQMTALTHMSGELRGFLLLLEDITEGLTNGSPPIRQQPLTVPTTVPTIDSRPEYYDFALFAQSTPSHLRHAQSLKQAVYTVFDIETTGLDPRHDGIVAIGAVRVLNGRLLRQEIFDQLIDPGRPIPRLATAIHGITDSMVEGEPPINDVLPRFARFIEETVLVGHNVAFDLRMFTAKTADSTVHFTQPILDTLLLSAVLHPDEKDHSLEAIAERLGVNVLSRHTALGDAFVTAEIFLRMIPLLHTQGIRTVADAIAASKKSYLARLRY